MTISLNTNLVNGHTELTFDNGLSAGSIEYDSSLGKFYHCPPDGSIGPTRMMHTAAEYDALAWAIELDAVIRLAADS